MTFDDELTLIAITYTENELGDQIESESRLVVLCEELSVTRSEHYAAAQAGMRPEVVFAVNMYDYDGQQRVEHHGDVYRIIRHYKKKKSKDISDFETIELVCQGVDS